MPQPYSSTPTRTLPEKPDLNQLKKQAKDLLKAFHAGERAAIEEVRAHHPQSILTSNKGGLQLSEAQLVLARAYGFDSWPKLKAFVDSVNISRFVAAVEGGKVERVRAMLRQRPDLVHMDTTGNNELRALHYAVLRRDARMVRLLMQAGADAHQGVFPHRDATTAIALSMDRGYQDVVVVIQEEEQSRRQQMSCPNTTVSPVQEQINNAIRQGDNRAAIHLLEANVSLVRACDHTGATALHVAAQEMNQDMVAWLLARGANPRKQDLQGLTPLDRAALAADPRNDEALRRLLLDRGAKLQPYMVSETHDVAEARRLLQPEASEELAQELTWSAAVSGCPEIVRLALPRLNWPAQDPRWHWILIQPIRGLGDNSGLRPAATTDDRLQCMEILLRHGIDANVSRLGQTVLHFAAARGGIENEAERVRFAAMLLDWSARLDLRDDLLKSTPLGWACRWGRKELVEVLIARGAPVNEPDAQPWATPLAWARKMGRTEIERQLRQHGAQA